MSKDRFVELLLLGILSVLHVKKGDVQTPLYISPLGSNLMEINKISSSLREEPQSDCYLKVPKFGRILSPIWLRQVPEPIQFVHYIPKIYSPIWFYFKILIFISFHFQPKTLQVLFLHRFLSNLGSFQFSKLIKTLLN